MIWNQILIELMMKYKKRVNKDQRNTNSISRLVLKWQNEPEYIEKTKNEFSSVLQNEIPMEKNFVIKSKPCRLFCLVSYILIFYQYLSGIFVWW